MHEIITFLLRLTEDRTLSKRYFIAHTSAIKQSTSYDELYDHFLSTFSQHVREIKAPDTLLKLVPSRTKQQSISPLFDQLATDLSKELRYHDYKHSGHQENVLEHSLNVFHLILIDHLLENRDKKETIKLLMHALLHDIAETKIGDVSLMMKTPEFKAKEKAIFASMIHEYFNSSLYDLESPCAIKLFKTFELIDSLNRGLMEIEQYKNQTYIFNITARYQIFENDFKPPSQFTEEIVTHAREVAQKILVNFTKERLVKYHTEVFFPKVLGRETYIAAEFYDVYERFLACSVR